MSKFGILIDSRFKDHVPGPGHPERPARLDAVASGLEREALLVGCERIEPSPATDDELVRLHTPEYLERLARACREGWFHIDSADSPICPASERVARLAAGGVIAAARQIGSGRLRRAFCAVRPPGHHAEAGESMGFCLYNNAALAAQTLLDEFGVVKILLLDWDVHHGNGTQHLFEDSPEVLYVSLHGHPTYLYPGTGFANETGEGAGAGYTINVPFVPGTVDTEYQRTFEERVLPAVEVYRPEVVIISAGFDAHADDPLGNLNLSDHAFVWMTRAVMEIADRSAGGRILSVLEGGYNLDALRRCTAEHVRELEGA